MTTNYTGPIYETAKYRIEKRQRPARASYAFFVIDKATNEVVSGSYLFSADATVKMRQLERGVSR